MAIWKTAAPIVMLFLLVAHRMEAHAILLAASPAIQEVVIGPDVLVKLRFNSRIDGKRSRLLLMGPEMQKRTLQIELQPSPDTLSARATALSPGSYILRWQVLANDGHITRGEVPFRVR